MSNYEFEMHDVRKNILKIIAENCREGNTKNAKFDCCDLIRRSPKVTNKRKTLKHFRTSYDKALDIVQGNDKDRIRIEEPWGLIKNDGAIDSSEVNGELESVVISIKEKKFGKEEKSVYPVYLHESGYSVCSCPSQKFSLVCKHTLARVIERNWPEQL